MDSKEFSEQIELSLRTQIKDWDIKYDNSQLPISLILGFPVEEYLIHRSTGIYVRAPSLHFSDLQDRQRLQRQSQYIVWAPKPSKIQLGTVPRSLVRHCFNCYVESTKKTAKSDGELERDEFLRDFEGFK